MSEILQHSISGLFAILGIGFTYLFTLFSQERQERNSLKRRFIDLKSENMLKRIDEVRNMVFDILANSDPDSRHQWNYQKLLQSKLRLELFLNNQIQAEVDLNFSASRLAIAVRDNMKDEEIYQRHSSLTDAFTKYRLNIQDRISQHFN